MNPKTRKAAILLLKAAIAAALLAWVLSQVHWRDYVLVRGGSSMYPVLEVLRESGGPVKLCIAIGPPWSSRQEVRPGSDFEPLPGGKGVIRPGFATSLTRINAPLAILGAMGFGAAMLLCSVRWWLLLRIQEIPVSWWQALRLTFLGQFFNAVVPGTVGGDLVKAWYVARQTPKVAAALVSVFVDRLVGLVGLAVMAGVVLTVVLLAGLADYERIRLPALSVGIILAAVAGLLAFLLSGRFRRALRLEKLYGRLPIAHHIAAAGDAVQLYRRRPGRMACTVAITLAAHLAFVGFIAVTGISLHLPPAWYDYFLYVPLVYIIGSIPLTPGGVGWVENWFVRFFETAQCGPSEILVLALLARLVPVLWGLPGALVAVTGARVPRPTAIEAELVRREEASRQLQPHRDSP